MIHDVTYGHMLYSNLRLLISTSACSYSEKLDDFRVISSINYQLIGLGEFQVTLQVNQN